MNIFIFILFFFLFSCNYPDIDTIPNFYLKETIQEKCNFNFASCTCRKFYFMAPQFSPKSKYIKTFNQKSARKFIHTSTTPVKPPVVSPCCLSDLELFNPSSLLLFPVMKLIYDNITVIILVVPYVLCFIDQACSR